MDDDASTWYIPAPPQILPRPEPPTPTPTPRSRYIQFVRNFLGIRKITRVTAEVRVETHVKCRLSTLKRMSSVDAETHVKCQLSILTAITAGHQTLVQKKS
jgi:hypothetical protein